MTVRGYLPGPPLAALIRARATENELSVYRYLTEHVPGTTTTRSYDRWKAGQPVRWHTADRVCCALGVHPAAIWPIDWYAAA